MITPEPVPGLDTGRTSVPFRHLAILVFISLIVGWPLLVHGAPELANDTTQHVIWAKNFSQQFWQGEAYPRWFMDSNAGYGSPVFFFYPPLPSYFAALFWPFVEHLPAAASRAEGLGMAVGLLLSGVFSYIWLRTLAVPRAALAGAIFYLIAPYHLAINLYNRGAAAEFWVFTWLPLVMWAAQGIVTGNRWAVVVMAIGYAMAVLSHPTVALVFAFIPGLYVLVFHPKAQRLLGVIKTGFGLGLGVALAGALMIPALLDQHKTHAHEQVEGFADYHYWWLFSIRDKIAQAGAEQAHVPLLLNFKVRILVITLLIVLLTGLLYVLIRRVGLNGFPRRIGTFFMFSTVIVFFLMLEQSDFVWHALPFLKFLEAASRLNTLLTVNATAMVALAFPLLGGARGRLLAIAAGGIVLGFLAADGWSGRWAYSVWRPIPRERASDTAQLLAWGRDQFSWAWPKDTQPGKVFDVPEFAKYIVRHPPRELQMKSSVSGQVTGTAQVVSWRPRNIVLRTASNDPAELTLHHFYYEGWKARLQDGHPIELRPTVPDGFMCLRLPPGEQQVVLELPHGTPESAGLALSGAAFLVLLASGGLALRTKPESATPSARS